MPSQTFLRLSKRRATIVCRPEPLTVWPRGPTDEARCDGSLQRWPGQPPAADIEARILRAPGQLERIGQRKAHLVEIGTDRQRTLELRDGTCRLVVRRKHL